MNVIKKHSWLFDVEDTILNTAFSGKDELVMLLSSGLVVRYNLSDENTEVLFSVLSDIGYADGGFDLAGKTTIYTMDRIVVVVNDFKRHGFVHYPGKYHALHLHREDYHADISCYPIALFKNESGVPHLIYGVAWNHVQIMNLDTRQIMTADKSLIEQHAEENHLKYYKTANEDNKLPWPGRFDYFYGKLYLSPDSRNFLSAGWAWGSSDAYFVFGIDDFIRSKRISYTYSMYWEHNTRGVCWIDADRIAVAYNPYQEGDDDAAKDSPGEIHIHSIHQKTREPEYKIILENLDLADSDFYFQPKTNSILAISARTGLTVVSLNGGIIFRDEHFKPDDYDPERNWFLKTSAPARMNLSGWHAGTDGEDKTVSVYELIF